MQSRKPLLLIHGALGSKRQFIELSNLLEDTYQVHAFDLPSHGELAWQEGQFTMFEFANYIRTYIEQNRIENPLAFGFSMGGYALLTLQSQANIFEKIMTLNTKFEWNKETAEREVKMLDSQKIIEKVPHYADYLISLHSEENWKKLLEKHKRLMYDMGGSNPLSHYALSKIHIPVSIMRGDKDQMTTKTESIEVAYQLARGEYSELENTEHPIEKIDKQELSNRIRDFLD
jgi:pimeloyl-ACP methyl ester carboxylesterase